MVDTKTIAEAFGLKKGVSISLTHTAGPHNGQTFNGILTCDVEVGDSVFMDNGIDITDAVVSVEKGEKGKLLLKTEKEECVIELKSPQ